MPKNNYPTFKNRSGIGSGNAYQQTVLGPDGQSSSDFGELALLKGRAPLHEVSPEYLSHVAYPTSITGQDLLQNELVKRYGTNDPRVIGKAFRAEIGLAPFKIKTNSVPALAHDENGNEVDPSNRKNLLRTLGQYYFDPTDKQHGQIDLMRPAIDRNPEIPDPLNRNRAGSFVHELGHAADDIYDSKNPLASNPHHAFFPNFNTEMAHIMSTQNAIERGIPVNENILDKYPGLLDTTPNASNPLVNPWVKQKPGLSPEIWNRVPSPEFLDPPIKPFPF